MSDRENLARAAGQRAGQDSAGQDSAGRGSGGQDSAGRGSGGQHGGGRDSAIEVGAADGRAADDSALRHVTDVETLKAMADPTRLAILTALMRRHGGPLPVMSVKELAAQLGEPQTKLYRHVRQLEAAGLIRVAASRLVSGILEQRYQANQRDLMFGPGLLRDRTADESEPVVAALLDRYRDGFFAAARAGLLTADDDAPEDDRRRGIMAMTETRVSASRADAVRAQLQAVMDKLNEEDAEDPDGVPVNVLIGYYSAEPGPGGTPRE